MTASQVTTRDVPPKLRSLPSVPLDVLMVVGVAPWGPINQWQKVVDFDDYLVKYGGYLEGFEMALQVRQFFINGGRMAVINRVVHVDGLGAPDTALKASVAAPTSINAATKGAVLGTNIGPFALVNGDTIVGDVDAAGVQTATIVATGAALECTAVELFALADGNDLTIKIDGGGVQTVTFNTAEFADIANATAEEVAAVINAELVGASAAPTTGGTKVTITSDTLGSAASVEVTGGVANAVLTFAPGVVASVGSNVADASSVTVAELKTIIEAALTNGGGVTVTDVGGAAQIEANTAGTGGSIQVTGASTANDELGLDTVAHAGLDGTPADTLTFEGKYEGSTVGHALSCEVSAATSGVAEQFNVAVVYGGRLVRLYQNLTMDAASEDYAITRISALSPYIFPIDGDAPGSTLEKRPVNGTYQLANGHDGLVDGGGFDSLDEDDFKGSQAYGTGLHAFDTEQEGQLLIVPDWPSVGMANYATNYCETEKRNTVVFIPDCPTSLTDEDLAMAHVQALTPSEQCTGLYWPRIKIANPDKSVFGSEGTLNIGVSGSAAGRYSGNTQDFKQGPFKQPGNELYGRLDNVIDVTVDSVKKLSVRDKITPARINPVMAGKDSTGAFGVWLNDVMALKPNGNFKSIGEIRGMALIRRVVMAYLETIRTTANTPRNRSADKVNIEDYLAGWASRGVFASTNATDAYYVNTDPQGLSINNPTVQEREEYNVVVGVATARARRFIDVAFTRDQRAIENFIQQQSV